MYKKITHHIVEEHYDHPAIVPATVYNCSTGTVMGYHTTGTVVKPKDFNIYNIEGLKQLEKDSINAWARLSGRIRSLVISITEGDKDIDILKSQISTDITELGRLVETAYGEAGSKKFMELLGTVATTLIDVLAAIKSDATTATARLTAKLQNDTAAFAEFLASVNPAWPADAVMAIFGRMEELYMAQTRHRIKKEWEQGVDAADKAYSIIVVNQENGDPSFSDIFSGGIIDAIMTSDIRTQ